LQAAKPDEQLVVIPDGLRATQYPAYFQGLSNFKAEDFLKTAQTGIEPDGTKLWTKYWFIKQPGSKTAYALEGYLYPAGYYFYSSDDTKTVIEKLLNQFGEELCPGPTSQPNAYLNDAAKCRANAAQVNGKNIFDLMRAAYPDAKDDATALNDALIISSFAVREIKDPKDLAGVAAVYHNRYLTIIGKASGDTGLLMGSDPSVEYARDTEKAPADGKWWAILTNGNKVATTNPYNTYTQAGMPPGPIANPDWTEVEGGAAPQSSKYYYFASDKCNVMHYATTLSDFNTNVVPKMDTGNC
jgi:cell division protein YceG involved in septum cleavage